MQPTIACTDEGRASDENARIIRRPYQIIDVDAVITFVPDNDDGTSVASSVIVQHLQMMEGKRRFDRQMPVTQVLIHPDGPPVDMEQPTSSSTSNTAATKINDTTTTPYKTARSDLAFDPEVSSFGDSSSTVSTALSGKSGDTGNSAIARLSATVQTHTAALVAASKSWSLGDHAADTTTTTDDTTTTDPSSSRTGLSASASAGDLGRLLRQPPRQGFAPAAAAAAAPPLSLSSALAAPAAPPPPTVVVEKEAKKADPPAAQGLPSTAAAAAAATGMTVAAAWAATAPQSSSGGARAPTPTAKEQLFVNVPESSRAATAALRGVSKSGAQVRRPMDASDFDTDGDSDMSVFEDDSVASLPAITKVSNIRAMVAAANSKARASSTDTPTTSGTGSTYTKTFRSTSSFDSNDTNDTDSDAPSVLPDVFFPEKEAPAKDWSESWTNAVKRTHKPILAVLQLLSGLAARNPKRAMALVTLFSFGIAIVGFLTNFNLDVDEDILWTPVGSKPLVHSNWINDESGFPRDSRFVALFFHQEGENVLGFKQVSRVFEALEFVRALDGYQEVCAESTYTNDFGVPICELTGIPRLWNSSLADFEASVSNDEQAIAGLSAATYPSGIPVDLNTIVGFYERDNVTGLLTSALSYTMYILLPPTTTTEEWEIEANHAVLALNRKWATEPGNKFRVHSQVEGSFAEEFTRSIVNDLPLVPIIFFIMSGFVATVFSKRHKVQSRGLLGMGAVFAVLLSIMSGFGVMFCAGTEFTSMTQLLPFVIFGIGLDDAFIIMGSYSRTDPKKDPVDRIAETIDDIGLSITLTTTTSATAFALGMISTIPTVDWLCMYAVPSILFVLLYQLTFFVGAIVWDERRIAARRRDLIPCIIVAEDYKPSGASSALEDDDGPEGHITDRIMGWYAEKLLRPWVKVVVVIAFAALAGVSAWSASQFSQEFKVKDVLPRDSYITEYLDALDTYSDRGHLRMGVYFRNVDQSDPVVQAQMEDYVNALVEMPEISKPPDYFWIHHLREFVNRTDTEDRPFNEQMELFLSYPLAYDIYNRDIVLDDEGNVAASRTFLYMNNIDLNDVNAQIDALMTQRRITQEQPPNVGKEEFSFFLYDTMFNIWEFYSVSVGELVVTIVLGIGAMTGVAMLFIPHWTAAVFILPLITVLFIDLLGMMQFAGIHINAVSYITLAMSIGLLVDFVLHVLFKFYESHGTRREKTVVMLRTMGASILLGGVTTFLGTLPLVFASSDIFYTVFIGFLGIVTLGMSHGLILVPVVLSTIGPECQISMAAAKPKYDKDRFVVC